MLTFLSIVWMGAKMMEVEVCGLRFSRTVNGEQWWRTKPTTKQPRCTHCRFALVNWDTSTDSGGGSEGAAAVEWGAVVLERGAGKVEEERMSRVVEGIMGYEIF